MVHTVSRSALHCASWNAPTSQLAVHEAQARSEMADGATAAYSPALHAVSRAQTVSLDGVATVWMYSPKLQVRVLMQRRSRWSLLGRYDPPGHGTQVPATPRELLTMNVPAEHSVFAVHDNARLPYSGW